MFCFRVLVTVYCICALIDRYHHLYIRPVYLNSGEPVAHHRLLVLVTQKELSESLFVNKDYFIKTLLYVNHKYSLDDAQSQVKFCEKLEQFSIECRK